MRLDMMIGECLKNDDPSCICCIIGHIDRVMVRISRITHIGSMLQLTRHGCLD
jgi:hypothetical protein